MGTKTKSHDIQTPCRNNNKNTLLTVNTNGLCLACFKECQENGLSESETSTNFLRVLGRYLGINFKNVLDGTNEKGKVDVHLFLCLDCSALAIQFMTIYRQYELNQMKLNFFAETLCGIMKSAERIPSRVQLFRQRFTKKKQRTKDANIHIDHEKVADNVRKEIILKCHQKTFGDLPRVMIDSSINTENRLVPYYPRNDDQEATLMMSFLGCIVSFWLVLSLSFFNPDEFIQTLKVTPQIEKEKQFISPTKQIHKSATAKKRVGSPVQEVVSLEACPLPKFAKLSKREETLLNSGEVKNVDQKDNHNIIIHALQTMKKGITEITSSNSTRRNATLITEKEDMKAVTTLQSPSSTLVVAVAKEQPATLGDKNNYTQMFPVNLGSTGTLVRVKEDLLEYPYTHTVNLFDCHLCNLQFDSRAKIEKHRAVTHSLIKYVECSACRLMFRCFSELQTHRIGSLNGQCQISETMKAHELLDIARPLFPYNEHISGNKFCHFDNCYEVFDSDDLLQVHLKSHGHFQCSFCDMTFGKAYDVAIHEVNMTCCQRGAVVLASSPEAKLYKCTRCAFGHLQPEQFVSHFVHKHLDVSPFTEVCSICNKGLLNKSAARMHFATHHYIKIKKEPDSRSELPDPEMNNNKCVECDKTFGSPNGLRVHLRNSRVHKPEKSRQLALCTETKNSCVHCGYTFPNPYDLKIHKISNHPTHYFSNDLPNGTTVKEFNKIVNSITRSCKMTQKKESRNYSNLSCLFCSRRSRNSYNLRIHILTAHLDKVLEKF